MDPLALLTTTSLHIQLSMFTFVHCLFHIDEPAVEATVNDHENLWNGTAVPLKSTLKQDGKKNARKMDHVSFEMNQIQHVRNSHLMYGGKLRDFLFFTFDVPNNSSAS